MTRHQFSLAVNAEEKWVENAARLLKRRLGHTSREARVFGLVRIFNRELGIPLDRAATLAEKALRFPSQTREARVTVDPSASASIVVDLARYHSSLSAALSAAMILAGPRKRGRPSGRKLTRTMRRSTVRERAGAETVWDVLSRAKRHGIDLDALRAGLEDSPAERLARAEENALAVAELRNAAAQQRTRARRAR